MARTVFDINIDFKKSKGSYVFDKRTNKPFLDLFSMFSSLPLGYNHSVFDASFDQKIKHIAHLRMSNNLFHSDEFEDFEKKFLNISFHNNLHFCSTGALAVEAALKCGYEYKKNSKAIVLGVKNSFHGINSWGFVTDSEISSVKNRVANYPKNNWELHSLDVLIEKLKNITQSISSVIIEPIQCTAGDIYLDVEKLKKIQELTSQTASLKEKQLLASKLQLKDNKCPVCDSNVDKLNPLFQEEHLKEEIIRIREEIVSKEKEREMYNQKRKVFSEKLQHSRDAEATLRAHSINNKEELLFYKGLE